LKRLSATQLTIYLISMESRSDSGFGKKELKRRTLLQRITGQHPVDNLTTEITNVLAEKPVLDITSQELEYIAEKYNTTLFRENMMAKTLYEQYLRYALADNLLTDSEIKNLTHLKYVLLLSDAQLVDVHENFYNEHARGVISDGVVSEEERDFLTKLKKALYISDDIAQKLYDLNATAMMDQIITQKVGDKMLSPNEEEEVMAVAHSLGIDLQKDLLNRVKLEKYRLYWKIQNENSMPTVEATLPMLQLETAHFKSYSNLYEYKQTPMQAGQTGTLKEKVTSGLYWKSENLPIESLQGQDMTLLDSGKVYVTNARLIFEGTKQTLLVPLDQITDFVTFKNGIRFNRMFTNVDKPLFIEVFNNTDIFSIIFGKVLANKL
jgi:hypothetical protein